MRRNGNAAGAGNTDGARLNGLALTPTPSASILDEQPSNVNGSPWYTIDEVAARIRYSVDQTRRLSKSGHIPCARSSNLPGARYQYSRAVIDEWIADGCPSPKTTGWRPRVEREATSTVPVDQVLVRAFQDPSVREITITIRRGEGGQR